MSDLEVVLGLLVVVAALATVARRLAVPPPILMLLGGIALGFVPGLPAIALAPDIVFLVFLPPLLASIAHSISRSTTTASSARLTASSSSISR